MYKVQNFLLRVAKRINFIGVVIVFQLTGCVTPSAKNGASDTQPTYVTPTVIEMPNAHQTQQELPKKLYILQVKKDTFYIFSTLDGLRAYQQSRVLPYRHTYIGVTPKEFVFVFALKKKDRFKTAKTPLEKAVLEPASEFDSDKAFLDASTESKDEDSAVKVVFSTLNQDELYFHSVKDWLNYCMK